MISNYSFLNLEIQRSQYIRPKITVHKAAETIQGRKLHEEIHVQKSNFFSFLVLASGKFLGALGREVGTCLIFCHSFSFSDNVEWHWGKWLILKDLLNEWVAEGVASDPHDFTGLCSCQQILIFHLSRPSHHVSSHIFLAFLRRKIRWCPIVYVVLLSFAGVCLCSQKFEATGKGYSRMVCAHPISVMGDLYYYAVTDPITTKWGTSRVFSIVKRHLVCGVAFCSFCSICSISRFFFFKNK